MAYLGERIRALLGEDPRITEKMMFGGLTFLMNGRILIGCRQDGCVLLSVGRDNYADALARPGASAMSQKGRKMTGFVWVDAEAIEEDDGLAGWLDFAVRAVAPLPPKEPKKPAARKAKPRSKKE